MTKTIIIALGLISVALCLMGCAGKKGTKTASNKTVLSQSRDYKKQFGTYVVQAGWKEDAEHSLDNNFFYVKAGSGNENQPDNIAVGIDSNPYQKSEHENFSKAIQTQMASQIAAFEGTVMTASGFTSKKGEIVYVFTITEADTGLVTNQYYIVGEKKHCLVQESNFSNSKECDEVAKKIVDSFEFSNPS